MAKFESKFNIGDEVYYLDDNLYFGDTEKTPTEMLKKVNLLVTNAKVSKVTFTCGSIIYNVNIFRDATFEEKDLFATKKEAMLFAISKFKNKIENSLNKTIETIDLISKTEE